MVEIFFFTIDYGKAGHPAPIIPPLNSRNNVKTTPTDSTPISISISVSAHQVKVIDTSGDIPIIVGSHKRIT